MNFQMLYSNGRSTVKFETLTMIRTSRQRLSLIPDNIKIATSLEILKKEIKKRKGKTYQCKLCKTYLQNIILCTTIKHNHSSFTNSIFLVSLNYHLSSRVVFFMTL